MLCRPYIGWRGCRHRSSDQIINILVETESVEDAHRDSVVNESVSSRLAEEGSESAGAVLASSSVLKEVSTSLIPLKDGGRAGEVEPSRNRERDDGLVANNDGRCRNCKSAKSDQDSTGEHG